MFHGSHVRYAICPGYFMHQRKGGRLRERVGGDGERVKVIERKTDRMKRVRQWDGKWEREE